MQTNLAGKNRYKLISVLRQGAGFHAYVAMDIETSGRETVLLNVYESGSATQSMAGVLYGMSASACADFRGCYAETGRFTAVFRYHEGMEFAGYFSKRHALEPLERLAFAQSLMHAVLETAVLPAEVQRLALRAENLIVRKNAGEIRINFILEPGAGEENPAALAAPLLEAILLRGWRACDEQIDFLDRLKEDPFPSMGAMYSAWRAVAEAIEQDLEKRANIIGQAARYLKRRFRQWKRKRKKKNPAV